MIAQRIALQEFVLQRHAELLKSWLHRPHVIRWWGEHDHELAALLRRPPSTHALIVADGVPVGYLCWGLPAADELTAAGLTDLPDALVDIDILIGEPRFVGHGIGPRALCVLLDQLRNRADVCWAGVGTSRSNKVAISAFEKAGFRLFKEFEDPDCGPCKYMVVDLREAAI
jgi:aminoglycoside 6'-N-acetyltransferase